MTMDSNSTTLEPLTERDKKSFESAQRAFRSASEEDLGQKMNNLLTYYLNYKISDKSEIEQYKEAFGICANKKLNMGNVERLGELIQRLMKDNSGDNDFLAKAYLMLKGAKSLEDLKTQCDVCSKYTTTADEALNKEIGETWLAALDSLAGIQNSLGRDLLERMEATFKSGGKNTKEDLENALAQEYASHENALPEDSFTRIVIAAKNVFGEDEASLADFYFRNNFIEPLQKLLEIQPSLVLSLNLINAQQSSNSYFDTISNSLVKLIGDGKKSSNAEDKVALFHAALSLYYINPNNNEALEDASGVIMFFNFMDVQSAEERVTLLDTTNKGSLSRIADILDAIKDASSSKQLYKASALIKYTLGFKEDAISDLREYLNYCPVHQKDGLDSLLSSWSKQQSISLARQNESNAGVIMVDTAIGMAELLASLPKAIVRESIGDVKEFFTGCSNTVQNVQMQPTAIKKGTPILEDLKTSTAGAFKQNPQGIACFGGAEIKFTPEMKQALIGVVAKALILSLSAFGAGVFAPVITSMAIGVAATVVDKHFSDTTTTISGSAIIIPELLTSAMSLLQSSDEGRINKNYLNSEFQGSIKAKIPEGDATYVSYTTLHLPETVSFTARNIEKVRNLCDQVPQDEFELGDVIACMKDNAQDAIENAIVGLISLAFLAGANLLDPGTEHKLY